MIDFEIQVINFKDLAKQHREERRLKFRSSTLAERQAWVNRIKQNRRANRSYGVVHAYDEDKNKFEKPIKVYPSEYPEWKNHAIVDFGSYASYYLSDLLKSYPFNKPLCIDACGRNHRGSIIWIAVDEINRALELAKRVAERKNLIIVPRI
jgi:hypothetical protein